MPVLPLFYSLLWPRSHITRSCRSLSRVAVSCWIWPGLASWCWSGSEVSPFSEPQVPLTSTRASGSNALGTRAQHWRADRVRSQQERTRNGYVFPTDPAFMKNGRRKERGKTWRESLKSSGSLPPYRAQKLYKRTTMVVIGPIRHIMSAVLLAAGLFSKLEKTSGETANDEKFFT